MNTPGAEWILAIFAILLGVAGGCVVGGLRLRRLRQWDLHDSVVAPSPAVYFWTLGIFSVVAAVVLPLAMYASDAIAPEQKFYNTVGWWGGLAVSVACCLLTLRCVARFYERSRQ